MDDDNKNLNKIFCFYCWEYDKCLFGKFWKGKDLIYKIFFCMVLKRVSVFFYGLCLIVNFLFCYGGVELYYFDLVFLFFDYLIFYWFKCMLENELKYYYFKNWKGVGLYCFDFFGFLWVNFLG